MGTINLANIGYMRPPLPFVGNKCRWWRELGEIARRIPAGWRVLDAFGGSYSIARIMKWGNPALEVTSLDYNGDYMKRLDAMPDTIKRLEKMWRLCEQYGEIRGGSVQGRFVRFNSKECAEKLLDIAMKAKDPLTLRGYLMTRLKDMRYKPTIVNKIPNTMPFTLEARDAWIDGLRIERAGVLGVFDAWEHVEKYDLVVCDPPYFNNDRYVGDAWRAQAYCREIARIAPRFVLFDRQETPIARRALQFGASMVERHKFSGNMCIGGETMFVKL